MNQYATMIRNLKSPEVMERLMHLYGRRDGMLVEQTGRYIGLLKRHEELFHENREVLMISAPGTHGNWRQPHRPQPRACAGSGNQPGYAFGGFRARRYDGGNPLRRLSCHQGGFGQP